VWRTLAIVLAALTLFSCRDTCDRRFGERFNTIAARFNTRLNREAALRHDLFEMRKAIDDYYADKKHYPASLDDLVRSKYLYAIPHDPMTQSARTWIPVRVRGFIYDIHSGANGHGCYGTSYRAW